MKPFLRIVGRVLRYGAPFAWAAVHLMELPPLVVGDMMLTLRPVHGAGLLYVVLGVLALMWRPRLWTVAPALFIMRLPMSVGVTGLPAVAEAAGTPMTALTLLLIGVTSLWRRLPGPLPNVTGTIVPNADGVGALTSLPAILFLAATNRFVILTVAATVFALWRAAAYARRYELLTRGRGWTTFLLAEFVVAVLCVVRVSPDWQGVTYYLVRSVVTYGVLAWAIQRAVFPWRNPTTTP